VSDITEKLEFTLVDGARTQPELTVYALSTCAFCKKAMDFLRKNDYRFRFSYVDNVDPEYKREFKRQLSNRFDVVVVFPILVVNDEKAYSGFTELIWSRAVGIS